MLSPYPGQSREPFELNENALHRIEGIRDRVRYVALREQKLLPGSKATKRVEIDIVIGPIQDTDDVEFEVKTIGRDDVVVVAADGHPLIGGPIVIADLAPFRWVLPARGIAMRNFLAQAFGARNLPPPIAHIEANSIVMLPSLIAQTNLLAYTSTRNLDRGRLGGIVTRLDLDDATMRRKLGAVRARNTHVCRPPEWIISSSPSFTIGRVRLQGSRSAGFSFGPPAGGKGRPGFHVHYPGRRQLPAGFRLLIELIREMRPLGVTGVHDEHGSS